MRAITKSAKIHPAAKKCCGWEEPAIYLDISYHLPSPLLAQMCNSICDLVQSYYLLMLCLDILLMSPFQKVHVSFYTATNRFIIQNKISLSYLYCYQLRSRRIL